MVSRRDPAGRRRRGREQLLELVGREKADPSIPRGRPRLVNDLADVSGDQAAALGVREVE
jgi:hypothetical protein